MHGFSNINDDYIKLASGWKGDKSSMQKISRKCNFCRNVKIHEMELSNLNGVLAQSGTTLPESSLIYFRCKIIFMKSSKITDVI